MAAGPLHEITEEEVPPPKANPVERARWRAREKARSLATMRREKKLAATFVKWREPSPLGPARGCQFPLWPDGERPLTPRYCGARSVLGRSWCAEHARRVFVY
jgi:hypothetical protein